MKSYVYLVAILIGIWVTNSAAYASVRIIEHPGLGNVGGLTVAPDGSLWFTSGRIVHLFYGKTYSYPQDNPDPSTYPFCYTGSPIVEGPDGSVYASVGCATVAPIGGFVGGLSRTTASTAMKSFLIDANDDVGGLTMGLDKRLYVISQSFDHPSGQLVNGHLWGFQNMASHPSSSEIGLGEQDSLGNYVLLTALTPGEDGSIWVTGSADASYNWLYRVVNVSGQLKLTGKFKLPYNSRPAGVVWGPDDYIWFTEAGSGRIGRADGAGHIREFLLPTANSSPNGIVVGVDGALWFTETNANKIGRITTAGLVSEYLIPTAKSMPTAMAAPLETSGSRVIWFVQSGTGQIGELRY